MAKLEVFLRVAGPTDGKCGQPVPKQVASTGDSPRDALRGRLVHRARPLGANSAHGLRRCGGWADRTRGLCPDSAARARVGSANPTPSGGARLDLRDG